MFVAGGEKKEREKYEYMLRIFTSSIATTVQITSDEFVERAAPPSVDYSAEYKADINSWQIPLTTHGPLVVVADQDLVFRDRLYNSITGTLKDIGSASVHGDVGSVLQRCISQLLNNTQTVTSDVHVSVEKVRAWMNLASSVPTSLSGLSDSAIAALRNQSGSHSSSNFKDNTFTWAQLEDILKQVRIAQRYVEPSSPNNMEHSTIHFGVGEGFAIDVDLQGVGSMNKLHLRIKILQTGLEDLRQAYVLANANYMGALLTPGSTADIWLALAQAAKTAADAVVRHSDSTQTDQDIATAAGTQASARQAYHDANLSHTAALLDPASIYNVLKALVYTLMNAADAVVRLTGSNQQDRDNAMTTRHQWYDEALQAYEAALGAHQSNAVLVPLAFEVYLSSQRV